MAGKVAGDPRKADLRREMLATRDSVTPAARSAASARITQKLLSLEAYCNARCVLAYMTFGSEFETDTFVSDALATGKRLCLPRLYRDAGQLEPHVVDNLQSLYSGVWGIREPGADSPRLELAQIDFVLVPGVAFTPRCERMGYGGGYYDRLIARFARRPALVAAAYALQVLDEIPLTIRDQRLDMVVTEDDVFERLGDRVFR